MKIRQAKKIVRLCKLFCKYHYDGPDLICTGGKLEYPLDRYNKAVRVYINFIKRNQGGILW